WSDKSPHFEDYEEYPDNEYGETDLYNVTLESTEPPFFPNQTVLLEWVKPLSNMSKEAGQSLKIKCEVTGEPPPISLRWFKNDAPLLEDKKRILIKPFKSKFKNGLGSRLRISSLESLDKGFYKCEASNGLRSIETSMILMVRPNPWSSLDTGGSHLPDFRPVMSGLPTFVDK
ncbi:hypothetical protein WDU94_001493, partial [Cyamophila willieti]